MIVTYVYIHMLHVCIHIYIYIYIYTHVSGPIALYLGRVRDEATSSVLPVPFGDVVYTH